MKKKIAGYTFSITAAGFWRVLKKAAKRLKSNSPLHLAGSTAFFATFSIAPIFIIIIQVLGSVLGEATIRERIIQKFAESAPDDSVQQLNRIMNGLQQLSGLWYVDVALILFLFFSASTLFSIIKNSVERLWRIKTVQNKGIGYRLKKRLFSVTLIVAAGALLVASLVGQSLQSFLGDAIADISPIASVYFKTVYRFLGSVVIAWIWFTFVYRYITDARPQWKTVLAGALFTTILFTIGRVILQAALSGTSLPSVYGASASLVLLQLFVFYISLLNYYGAAFTIEWARHYRQPLYLPGHISYYTIEEKHTKEDP
ncbi:MAG TPA: YihY/virulence factor BrkB family protein [Flavisolibacter sp.]|jgi:membrane protein|nr:YihY/virulence factor BrkB family protein [Flavisolibacter sp.]